MKRVFVGLVILLHGSVARRARIAPRGDCTDRRYSLTLA
jgi:hypothetical protein